MCDVGEAVVDLSANLATGGLYSMGKAAQTTVETGDSGASIKALSMGPMGASGSDVSADLGGDEGREIFDNTWKAFSALASLGAVVGGPDVLLSGGEGFGAAGTDVLSSMDPSIMADPSLVSGGMGADTLVGSGADALTSGVDTGMGEVAAQVGPPGAPEVAANTPTPAVTLQGHATVPGQVLTPDPTIFNPTPQGGLLNYTTPDLASNIGAGVHGAGLPAGLPAGVPTPTPNDIPGWWGSLSPAAQAAVMLVAGQTAAGAAGGLFQGMSAEDRLEFDRFVNQQKQDQRQYQNKNNAFAPKVSFSKGLINRVGA